VLSYKRQVDHVEASAEGNAHGLAGGQKRVENARGRGLPQTFDSGELVPLDKEARALPPRHGRRAVADSNQDQGKVKEAIFHGQWDKWAPPPNYGGAVMVAECAFGAAADSGWDGRPVPQRPRPMYSEGHVMPGLRFDPGQRGLLI
jgi:hypothetical protein